MNKAQTYRFFALSQALSPIAHMSGTNGNEAVLMRKPVFTPSGETRYVPCLTGNALRHQVRESGGKFLIEQLGLAGATDKRTLNFLLHGGDRTEKGRLESLGGQARMYELFPFLKILAGSIPNQIMKSMSKVWFGWLVCEETRDVIRYSMPAGWSLDANVLFPAEHFVGNYQIIRGDVEFNSPELLSPTEAITGGDNRMMAAGQTVIAGSYFAHGYHLEHAYLRDVGCLLHSLSLWQHNGGKIGGKSAAGFGRLKTQLHVSPQVNVNECIEEYLAHLAANIDACNEWLKEAFASAPPPVKTKPPAKSTKPAKAKPEAPVTLEEGGMLWEESTSQAM